MKILLIEDDIEISEMLCSYLIAENFEVVCATDGSSGSQPNMRMHMMFSLWVVELIMQCVWKEV